MCNPLNLITLRQWATIMSVVPLKCAAKWYFFIKQWVCVETGQKVFSVVRENGALRCPVQEVLSCLPWWRIGGVLLTHHSKGLLPAAFFPSSLGLLMFVQFSPAIFQTDPLTFTSEYGPIKYYIPANFSTSLKSNVAGCDEYRNQHVMSDCRLWMEMLDPKMVPV